jgi:fumarate hydratase class I
LEVLRAGVVAAFADSLAPQASPNDRFVALELLKNANVAAGMVLPGCQDTGAGGSGASTTCLCNDQPHSYPAPPAGTAIVQGKKGQFVWTDGADEEALSHGVFDTYVQRNLRYSQARGR